MKERIIEFLRTENKSSALFADEIGVQPSGISHIISGRNNPSLDFIMKMLSKYPALSADWLLFGRGKMFRDNTIGDLFNSGDFNPVETDKMNQKQVYESAKPSIDLIESSKSPVEKGNITQLREAKRIICFFDNNTFTEYFPAKDGSD